MAAWRLANRTGCLRGDVTTSKSDAPLFVTFALSACIAHLRLYTCMYMRTAIYTAPALYMYMRAAMAVTAAYTWLELWLELC